MYKRAGDVFGIKKTGLLYLFACITIYLVILSIDEMEVEIKPGKNALFSPNRDTSVFRYDVHGKSSYDIFSE